MISWLLLLAVIGLAAAFFQRMKARAQAEESRPDEGQAILDFGRAFPDEAIRSIHPTLDGRAFFVRLHDGRAGFMLSQGARFICHLMTPGKVRVSPARMPHGLQVAFADFPYLDGLYQFADAETAAEVSLWILGSFSAQASGK